VRLDVEAHGIHVSIRALTKRRAQKLWAMARDLVEANIIEDEKPVANFGFVNNTSLETEIVEE
jgi:hypothetical protein